MRKRIILCISVILAIFLIGLTVASYIHYERSIPEVTVILPEPDPESGTYPNYTDVILPVGCLRDGTVYVVKERKGLFSDEFYLEVPRHFRLNGIDEEYIHVPVGVLLTTDMVVLTADGDIANGIVVKLGEANWEHGSKASR